MTRSQVTKLVLGGVLVALILSSFKIADVIIDYNWWKELGQVRTWITMLSYRVLPATIGSAALFCGLWIAHDQGLRFAGVRTFQHRSYSRIIPVILAAAAVIFASSSIDWWAVMKYAGARRVPLAADAWRDPVFSHTLFFYFFDLPFYSELLSFALLMWVCSTIVFWITARGWQLVEGLDRVWNRESVQRPPGPALLLLPGATRSDFARVMGSLLLILLSAWLLLGNYDLLLSSHAFMTGADYVDEKIVLPLRWLLIFLSLAAIPFVWNKHYKRALILLAAGYVLLLFLPGVIRASYVRPNEISLERPYIQRHLEASSTAFGLNRRATTRVFPVSGQESVDATQHAALLDNIRLWDWRAYRDTITQIQALRPYYTFADTDVDRYVIDGHLKQVLLSPREIDVRQLPADASQSWVNPNLVYTHGYGVVMSEVNKTTRDGLPVFLIENAPPEINSPSLHLTRPEIYYGESTHEPVFVNTAQKEFDYPAADQNKYSAYQGKGGFPIGSLLMRSVAALSLGDSNILFTGYFAPQSRMMIRRDIRERLENLAGFLEWDPDPYLVITQEGRLMWIIDGYSVSQAFPYSSNLSVTGLSDGVNYIRNSVKATVDAYDGTVTLYVFDPSDPIIQVYQMLFPDLLRPESEMPAELRQHARYPEVLFRTQAEAYRTFHMRDPQVFYNKEDVWDIASNLYGQSGKPEPMSPTYVIASLPGETSSEYLLILPFTPRGKDNLIGWMAARCDGEHLNELVFFQLSKQQLVYGPMQIESRVDQDQTISKDLTLWNQEGSRVRRGNLIVLPLKESFLYVESIYIQATEARMPQLKKVVLALGNRLIYRDTFEEALAELTNNRIPVPEAQPTAPATAASSPASPATDQRLSRIADRLKQLREQTEKLTHEIESLEKEAGSK